MIKIILSIIVLLGAVLIGFISGKIIKDEKKIYERYFPALLWILVILAAVFYTLDVVIALTITFMFLIIFTWNRI